MKKFGAHFRFMQLRPHQIAAVEAFLATKDRFAHAEMCVSCHAKGTQVIMLDGTLKAVENLVIGDQLLGPDSRPRKVLSLARGRDQMVTIHPDRGASFVVNQNHILALVQTPRKKNSDFPSHRGGRVIFRTVEEWRKETISVKRNYKMFRASALDFAPRPVPPIDPWIVGAALGDGHFGKGCFNITTADMEIDRAFSIFAASIGCEIRRAQKENNKAWGVHFRNAAGARKKEKNRALVLFETVGISNCDAGTKYIPDIYLKGSKEVRLQVLAGLLDTDGHLSGGGKFEFVSKSADLANGVVFLARSLGFHASEKARKIVNGTCYYRTHISGATYEIPTKLPRKWAKIRKMRTDPLRVAFEVKPIGEGDYYGFHLDGDHLYMTSDFFVHHNSGKSLVMAELARRSPGRVLILAHTAELVKQNLAACKQLHLHAAPCARTVGINPLARVTVGTIQTVVRRASLFKDVQTIVVDETHLVSPDEASMYRRLFDAIPKALVRGLTGTPYRADGSGSLEESFGPCVFRFTFGEALELGYVKPLRQIDAEADSVDTVGIKISRGEWDTKELAHRGIELAPIHARAALTALRSERRRRALAFCCDILHSDALAREFNVVAGRRVAASVHSELSHDNQDRLILDFREGRLPIMTSVQKFTVGFSVEEVDSLILCRPVRSRVYYVQALGRGARKTDAAHDCCVVDFGGNISRHGTLDMVKALEVRVPRTKSEREAAAKSAFKNCRKCGSEFADFFDSCPHCGYDSRLDREIGGDLLLRSKAKEMLAEAKVKPMWLAVKGPPKRTANRHWVFPLETGNAIWWGAHLPAAPVHVYVRWHSRWGFTTEAFLDSEGVMYRS